MPKPQRRPAPRGPAPKGGKRRAEDDFMGDGSDSDNDAFKAKKDKISLNMSDDDVEDDEDDVEAVYGIDADEDEDGDEDDEDGEEDEDEDQDDLLAGFIKEGGENAQLAKAAKALGQKLKLQRGEDDDDDEEGANAGQRGGDVADRLWGANKRAYYDADTAQASDDEEAVQLEEQEGLKIQRDRAVKLARADFGLEDDEDEEDEDEDEDEDEEEEEDDEEGVPMGKLASQGGAASAREKQQQQQQQQRGGKKRGAAAAGDAGPSGRVTVEAVERDLSALGDEARMAALMADAPELLSLLQDLQESLGELRHRVSPLLTELRDGGLGTSEGLSYLEAKHLLLLTYSIHIVFYLLLKAEGRPVRDHPVIARLVELRAYLEKIRPIDKQLAYQIDKLLKAAQMASAPAPAAAAAPEANGRAGEEDDAAAAAGGLDGDALRYGPRPNALVPKVKGPAAGGAAAGEGDEQVGVYRPPKITPVSMELDEQRAAGGEAAARVLSAQERRRLKELKAKASRSDTMRALAAELAGAPEEERAAVVGLDSAAALRTRAKLAAREAVEEDNFIRVPLTKDEAKRLRQQRRAGLSGAGMLEDFGDEVADLVDMARGSAGAAAGAGPGSQRGNVLNELFARQKVSQRFGADDPALSRRPRGGDEDLPVREPLHERRAKFDAAAARRAARAGGGSEDFDDGDGEYDLGGGAKGGKKKRRAGEEDDFYAQAKADAAARKKARAEAHRAPALAPPVPDPTAEGARGITDEIQRNRGLTPHRRRDQKNPRKKNRMKFEKAMVRIKGAVQPVRKPEAVAYGGEATGIKAKVAKSRRL